MMEACSPAPLSLPIRKESGKTYKLGVCYNVFDCEELLEGSIKSIRGDVDFITVVYQIVSNYNERCNPHLVSFLTRLKTVGLIDLLIPYTPQNTPWSSDEAFPLLHPSIRQQCNAKDHVHPSYLNEATKRELGRLSLLENGCSHFLAMDCDEYFIPGFLTTMMSTIFSLPENSHLETSFIRLTNYGKYPTIEYSFDRVGCVPFISQTTSPILIGSPYPTLHRINNQRVHDYLSSCGENNNLDSGVNLGLVSFLETFSIDPTRCVCISDYLSECPSSPTNLNPVQATLSACNPVDGSCSFKLYANPQNFPFPLPGQQGEHGEFLVKNFSICNPSATEKFVYIPPDIGTCHHFSLIRRNLLVKLRNTSNRADYDMPHLTSFLEKWPCWKPSDGVLHPHKGLSERFSTVIVHDSPLFPIERQLFGQCYICCDSDESHLSRCSQCQQICYCSKSCQREDWSRHKKHCHEKQ